MSRCDSKPYLQQPRRHAAFPSPFVDLGLLYHKGSWSCHFPGSPALHTLGLDPLLWSVWFLSNCPGKPHSREHEQPYGKLTCGGSPSQGGLLPSTLVRACVWGLQTRAGQVRTAALTTDLGRLCPHVFGMPSRTLRGVVCSP